MCLLTFRFLRSCKSENALVYNFRKRCSSSDKLQPRIDVETPMVSSAMIDMHSSWPSDDEAMTLREAAMKDMRVLPDFVTETEEAELMKELEPVLKKMRYEFDHWDNAIHGFRETEKRSWNPANQAVMSRVLKVAFSPGSDAGDPLPYQHVLDLAMAGEIKPHVDAVRFCGGVIAGISLLSAAVMRVTHTARAELALDALLPPRSLYVMRGVCRYQFEHAVLGGEASTWRGEPLRRLRRVAVITRSQPRAGDTL